MRMLGMNFLCKYCESSFESRNKLFIHLKNVHRGSQEINSNSNNSAKSNSNIIDDFPIIDISLLESQIQTISEDEWYRVVLKPQGLATMGVKGTTLHSSDRLLLPNAISLQLRYKKAVPCHRLDSSTGGLVVCSKSKASEVSLMKSFRSKFIKKTYLAIVAGKLEPFSGTIDSKVGDKDARTLYEVVKYTRSAQYDWLSTVKLWPVTGRKHQLRRHMAELRHAIIGDRRYSFASSWPAGGFDQQFLWSVSVAFPHPRSFPLLEAITQCCSSACGDIVVAIERPQEDIDFDVILRPYYSTIHNGSGSCEKEQHVERDGEGVGADGLGNRSGSSESCYCNAATRVETVIVKIPEPEYYEEFRAMHEKEFADLHSATDRIS